jgi:CheY-like chemotaxis protein
VVTDLMMPEMNGLELIETLKKDYPLTPVVMMTSQGSEEIAVMALEKGAASYVPKRILNQRLPKTVYRILEASREEKNHVRLMERLIEDECAFVLENDITMISTLVRYFRQGIRGVRLCEETEITRIGIAIEEALLNAYYHGNLDLSSDLRVEDPDEFDRLVRQRCQESPYQDRRIFVRAKYSETEAVFIVRDQGSGFDASKLPDPTDPENLLRPSGRGLLLMRVFMDELQFNETGNEVTMIKRRDAGSRKKLQRVS